VPSLLDPRSWLIHALVEHVIVFIPHSVPSVSFLFCIIVLMMLILRIAMC
jgi:hypothetical protein